MDPQRVRGRGLWGPWMSLKWSNRPKIASVYKFILDGSVKTIHFVRGPPSKKRLQIHCRWWRFLSFNRYSKILVQLFNEMEIRYSVVSSLLNGTEIYSRLSSSMTSLVRFQDVFNLTGLSEELIEIGVDSNTVQLLLQTFVNVNRVRLISGMHRIRPSGQMWPAEAFYLAKKDKKIYAFNFVCLIETRYEFRPLASDTPNFFWPTMIFELCTPNLILMTSRVSVTFDPFF